MTRLRTQVESTQVLLPERRCLAIELLHIAKWTAAVDHVILAPHRRMVCGSASLAAGLAAGGAAKLTAGLTANSAV